MIARTIFTAAIVLCGISAWSAVRPIYSWDFERDNGRGQCPNGGSGPSDAALYVAEVRTGQGKDGSSGCFVGKAVKRAVQKPMFQLDWAAFTLDLSFKVDSLPSGGGDARRTLFEYLWDIYGRAEARLSLLPEGRFEVRFVRRGKEGVPAVDWSAISSAHVVRPGVFCDLRLSVAEDGELVLWADGMEVLRKGGAPSLAGIKTGSPKWLPLMRIGVNGSNPERMCEHLEGVVDDVALYNKALGAPEIVLPKKADYSGVKGPDFKTAADGASDLLILDESGHGATGRFRVLDREGELAGSWVRADDRFFENAARAELQVDDSEIKVVVDCGVPAGMKTSKSASVVFQGDVVEFFIRPDLSKPEYYQYGMNANGLSAALRHPEVGVSDDAFKSRSKMSVAATATGFVVTISVPVDEVFKRAPGPGDAFAVNFTRTGETAGGLSTWAAVGRNFNNPSLFGRVVFGGPAPYFKRRLAQTRDGMRLRFGTDKERMHAAEGAVASVEKAVEDHGADPAAFSSLEKMFCNLDRVFLKISLEGRSLLVYAPENPWGNDISPKSDTAPLPKIVVKAPRNSKTRIPFAVANLSDRPFIGQVKFFNFGPEKFKFYCEKRSGGIARRFKLYETIPTWSATDRIRYDAVAPVPLNTLVRVQAHDNVLLWAELDTHGVTAGRYFAKMIVKKAVKGFETQEIPVEVEVVDADMDSVRIDRAEYNHIQGFRPQCRRLLRELAEKGVNVMLTNTPGYDGFKICPTRGKDGRLVPGNMKDLDEKIDAVLASGVRKEDLKIWIQQALNYRWCSTMRRDGTDMAHVGEPEWHEWLESILKVTSAHLKEKYGIGKDRIIWYTMDEPGGDIDDPKLESSMSKAYYAAKAIKKVDPEFVTFTDPTPYVYPKFDEFLKDFRKLAECYDIIQVYRPFITDKELEIVKTLGFKEVWTYSILHTDDSPITYRLDFWKNMRDGFNVATHWCHEMTAGGDAFDSSDGKKHTVDYAAVYVDYDNDASLPSRREFAREDGWEDARLVQYLRTKHRGDAKKLGEIERIVRDAAATKSMTELAAARNALLDL